MFDLTDKKNLFHLLRKYGIHLKKSLGQNFLVDKEILEKIVEASNINQQDTIIEIGAGVGTLTNELCQLAKKIITFEMDLRMIKILNQEIKPLWKNLQIIEGDFLKKKPKFNQPYKVVANLPYQITSPVIRLFLEGGSLPKGMVFMIQKEVSERLTAKPGSAKRGWLSVLVQLVGDVRTIAIVKPESFWPKPKVDSAIFQLSNIRAPDGVDLQKLLPVVRAGFSSKRRQLHNALSGGLGLTENRVSQWLEKLDIDPKRRAETLNGEEWIRLGKIIVAGK